MFVVLVWWLVGDFVGVCVVVVVDVVVYVVDLVCVV